MITSPEIIETRMTACAACDKSTDMSANPLYFFVNALGETIQDATKTMCSECSCPIWVKVRVPSNSCPLNKWKD